MAGKKKSSASLDHIGIAVRPGSRLAEALAILNLPVTEKESVAQEEVDVEWVPLPATVAHVELLYAQREESTIGKFLAKIGRDGIHHLCFRVDDIEEVSERLLQAGFKLVYPKAKPGAHGCRVNFLHPGSTGGVLLEINEKK